MSRRNQLGFDRKLELRWLDLAAAKAAEGLGQDELRDYLLERLESLAHEEGMHGSARAKTVRVILRVWGGVDRALQPLHDRALDLLPKVKPEERLAIHWAMLIAAYPFFADHADIIGRLSRLQDTITVPQIRRRIAELWGDRSTVFRTSRHVVRSMVDWGVLDDVGKGEYSTGSVSVRLSEDVSMLLIEALLLDTENKAIAAEQLCQHSMLFPFDYDIEVGELRKSSRFEIHRQGVDRDMLLLRL